MYWKRILSAGFAVCVLTSSALADPSILAIPRPYSAANGGIRWEIFVTQNDDAYVGALSVELPLSLGPHNGPAFTQTLADAGGDDTNGAVTNTWYYNETAAASGTLLWNISDPADASNLTQNNGVNPYAPVPGTITDGLEIYTADKRLFASLGSTVGLPDALSAVAGKQVRLMHVFTSDGILSWTDAIVGENGVQYSGISGSKSSIIAGDLNGNGNANATTGAFQDPTTLADIGQFLNAAGTAAQSAMCSAAQPGLNCEKRGDFGADGITTLADIGGFLAAIQNPAGGAGAESLGGSAVPEPASAVMLIIGGVMACVWRRRR